MVARYGYDAYGNTSASGIAANLNRYRFSTKEQIGGLYSYGYRFYSPSLGRWINRDPIAEKGGFNLYGFVKNNPISNKDQYGLLCWDGIGGISGCGDDDSEDDYDSGSDDDVASVCLDAPFWDPDRECDPQQPDPCPDNGDRDCDAEQDECIDDCYEMYPDPGWERRGCLARCMAAYILCKKEQGK